VAKLKLAAVQVRPEDREAEITEAAKAVTPVMEGKPPRNKPFIVNPDLQMSLWTLKVSTGGKDEYPIVLDPEVIESHRSRLTPRIHVVALSSEGLYYVFSVSEESDDTWSKSGRKLIAAAKDGPVSHWTDNTRKKYRFSPATKDLGKLTDPHWAFDTLEEYVELAFEEDFLIDSMSHSLVCNFEAEAPESAHAADDE
jgi:WD40 repeat protein